MNAAREGTMLDFIEDFTERFPARIDEYETLLNGQPHLETAYGKHRCRIARTCHAARL